MCEGVGCCRAQLPEARLTWRQAGRGWGGVMLSDLEARGQLIQELSQAEASLGAGPRVLTGNQVLGQGPGQSLGHVYKKACCLHQGFSASALMTLTGWSFLRGSGLASHTVSGSIPCFFPRDARGTCSPALSSVPAGVCRPCVVSCGEQSRPGLITTGLRHLLLPY